MGYKPRAIYKADTWHVDDGTGSDGNQPSAQEQPDHDPRLGAKRPELDRADKIDSRHPTRRAGRRSLPAGPYSSSTSPPRR